MCANSFIYVIKLHNIIHLGCIYVAVITAIPYKFKGYFHKSSKGDLIFSIFFSDTWVYMAKSPIFWAFFAYVFIPRISRSHLTMLT